MRMLALAVAVASIAGGAVIWGQLPAFADGQTSVSIAGQRVSYADLNVATDVGADRVLRRARRAAGIACDVRFDSRPENVMTREEHCVREALQQGVRDIGSPTVSARYERDAEGFVFFEPDQTPAAKPDGTPPEAVTGEGNVG